MKTFATILTIFALSSLAYVFNVFRTERAKNIDCSIYDIELQEIQSLDSLNTEKYAAKVVANNYCNASTNKIIENRIEQIKAVIECKKSKPNKPVAQYKIDSIFRRDSVCADKRKLVGRLFNKDKCKEYKDTLIFERIDSVKIN